VVREGLELDAELLLLDIETLALKREHLKDEKRPPALTAGRIIRAPPYIGLATASRPAGRRQGLREPMGSQGVQLS